MADDVTLPGTGARIATDEVASRQFQIVKVAHGADGAATLVSSASGLPVAVMGSVPVSGALTDAELRATPVAVSDGGASITVDGPLTDAQLRAVAVPVSGPLTDAQLRSAAVPVSGPATDAQLRATPLPVTGPITDAQLRAAAVAVSDGGGSLTIDGTVGVSGTVAVTAASLPLPAGAATEATIATLAAATALEDAPSASGDRGMVMLAQRRDIDASAADTDGDYVTLKMDEAGRLKTASQPASYAATIGTINAINGQVAVNTSRISNVMIQMRVPSAVAGHNISFEGSLNSTNGTDGNWFAVQAVRSNANTIELTTGALAATPAYAWEASVNGLNWFRVRANAHTSGAAEWIVQPASYATEPIPAAQISGTQPVSGTVTANIGTGALAAGANLIGDVGIQVRANATGAASIHHIVSAASTNVVQIKATAGRVYGYCLSNTTASWRYVKLHNVASATAGAAVARTIGIPPNGKAECVFSLGIGFGTAISRSIVGGAADADATAVGVNDVVGDIFFA